jgi:hypothetical protein
MNERVSKLTGRDHLHPRHGCRENMNEGNSVGLEVSVGLARFGMKLEVRTEPSNIQLSQSKQLRLEKS